MLGAEGLTPILSIDCGSTPIFTTLEFLVLYIDTSTCQSLPPTAKSSSDA